MSDPTTDNKLADVVSRVLKELIEGEGKDAIEATLLQTYPFLGLPFIKQVFEMVLNEAVQQIYINAARVSTSIIIDVQVNQESSGVLNSFQNLQMAIASGDKNAIAMASADLSVSYGNLIHSDGWSTP